MPRRPVCLLVLALMVAGCGASSEAKAPTATVGPPDSTERTTTTAKALTPEDEVEAAYLKSWDVYARAALSLDPSELKSAYADRALEIVSADIEKFKRDNTPARFQVEHSYKISISTAGIAAVRDDYVNHSVLLDPATKEPTEPDPNKKVSEVYLLKEVDNVWKVITIQAPPS